MQDGRLLSYRVQWSTVANSSGAIHGIHRRVLAGAAASASALVIGYFGYARLLRAERRRVRGWDSRLSNLANVLTERERQVKESIEVRSGDIENRQRQLNEATAAFEARKVKYDSLVQENGGLKQDCFNLSVQLKKMERDHAALAQRQEQIDGRANELAGRYLKENVSWIGGKLNANNFSSCKQRLVNVIGACRSIGFDVPEAQEQELVQNLQNDFEQAVRDELLGRSKPGSKHKYGKRKDWPERSTSKSRTRNAKRRPFKLPLKRPSKKPKTNTALRSNSSRSD